MKKRMSSGRAAIIVLGMFAGTAAADDAGMVRISDVPALMPASATTSTTTATVMNDGQVVDGTCDGPGYRHRCCLSRGGCYCPTRGFRPVATAPIYRDAINYGESQYWPAKFYGQPGWNLRPVFPQVFVPTDTTQLGFYYARVPQWLPNPSMYPAPPVPSDWHRRVVYTGSGMMAAGGVEMGASGQMMSPSGPTPVSPAPVPAPQMAPAPVPGTAPAPPAAPEPPSASTGGEAQQTQPVALSPTPPNQ